MLVRQNVTLSVKNLGYGDTGYYTCNASISVLGRTFSVSQRVHLTVQGTGVCSMTFCPSLV